MIKQTILFLTGVLLLVSSDHVFAAEPCSTYTAANTPQSVLGVPYSIFNAANPLIFRARCTDSAVSLAVGDGNQKLLVYEMAYMEFAPGEFTPVTLKTGSGDTNWSGWIITDVTTGSVPVPETAHGKTVNAYTFICQVRSGAEGKSLKCGCNESTRNTCLNEHGTHMGTWTHQRVALPEKVQEAPPVEEPPAKEPMAGAHPDITKILSIPQSQILRKPGNGWADSYSVGNHCYCKTTYDHNIGPIKVDTSIGRMTVKEVCTKIGPGPGSAGRPLYNDVQCGHGPANDVGDEDWCPGRVDMGKAGCTHVGPTWKFK